MSVELTKHVELHKMLQNRESLGLITVDGFTGVGKTRFAESISKTLNVGCLDFDNFVKRINEGLYFKYLKIEELKARIRAETLVGKSLVVSGVLINMVLTREEWPTVFRVYIKRQKEDGIWHDGFDIDCPNSTRDYHSELAKELLCYHRDYRPHENCDFLLRQYFDYV